MHRLIIKRNKVTRAKSYSNGGSGTSEMGRETSTWIRRNFVCGRRTTKKACEQIKRCKNPVGFARWDAKYIPIDIFGA